MFIIKKKIVLILLFIIIINFSIIITKAVFTSSDVNKTNFIELGDFEKEIHNNDISIMLFGATGPKFTHGVEIPHPYNNSFKIFSKLASYPYHSWSKGKIGEIKNIMQNHLTELPKDNETFAKNNDKNYFKKNNILFNGIQDIAFYDKSFHLFVSIYNNIHLNNNSKKLNLTNDKLLFEAFMDFKGLTTGRIWPTSYKGNIDFSNNRYYITYAYKYNTKTKLYEELKRGSWYFYNDADLVITDLGSTGYIEMEKNNWKTVSSLGVYEHVLLNKMKTPFNGKFDTLAKVIKSKYRITYIPDWDKSNVTKKLLYLGQ